MAILILAANYPDRFHAFLQIFPKIQFGQQAAGLFSQGSTLSLVVFLVFAVLTVFSGRLFCGFLCPLGALMDLALFLRQKTKKRHFSHLPDRPWRVVAPLAFLAAFWLGFTMFYGHAEPYSLLLSGSPTILFLIVALALARGRAFCNSLCPAGLILRFLAKRPKISLFLKKDVCRGCGACRRVCPASCLDVKEKAIDYGRCLVCLECAAVCPDGALKYGVRPTLLSKAGSPVKEDRRRFLRLTGAAVLAGGAYLTPAGLRAKLLPPPDVSPILPPGALSLARLNANCTLCRTCIRACPNEALKISQAKTPLLAGKPVISPYEGFCQHECVVCGEVCPTGALRPLSAEEKKISRLGLAKLNLQECVVIKNGTSCGACAEICPTGSVNMVTGASGREEPAMSPDYCIGCGACQFVCPVRPTAAIVVEGLSVQQTAKPPVVVVTDDAVMGEEFPF